MLIESSPDFGCAYGYHGNLCSNCIDGYGKTKDKKKCFDCANNPNIYVQLVFAILIVVGLIAFSTRSALKKTEEFDVENP